MCSNQPIIKDNKITACNWFWYDNDINQLYLFQLWER